MLLTGSPFQSLTLANPFTAASFIPHGSLFARPSLQGPECMIVVDSGFSFTHVVPILRGEIVWAAVKR